MVSVMDNLVDALHGQVELLRQRFKRYAQCMASADEVITVLCRERFFKRHSVGV
jgi:hypothetical protein